MPRHGLGDCAILSLLIHERRILFFNQAAVALLNHFSDSDMGAVKPLSQYLSGFWEKGKEKTFNLFPKPNAELKMVNRAVLTFIAASSAWVCS
jgi:hypothetical protein